MGALARFGWNALLDRLRGWFPPRVEPWQRYRPARPILTLAEHDHFDREGFLVIDPQIPDLLLDGVWPQIRDRLPKAADGGDEYPYRGRTMDAWKTSPAVKSIATWPHVLAILGELYGRLPRPFQTLNFPVGTEQDIHSDTIHFNSEPAGFMCAVWVALEDMDLDNGPLVYYPGSHKLPEYTFADVPDLPEVPPQYRGDRELSGSYLYQSYPPFSRRVLAERGLAPSYATVRKGQAFVWSSNLMHGGSPRRDRRRSRHSQVTHYFFPGCRYYTPLLDHGRRRRYRRPEWVV